jgi:hypothetical protein
MLIPAPKARRTRTALVAGFGIAALIAATLAGTTAHAAPSTRAHVRVLAPGVALTTTFDRRVPVRTYVLWIDPAQGATIGMTMARGGLGSLQRTSDMARDAGAIAAVNGDLGSTIAARPVHPFALDGELVQTSPVLGAMFSISSDGAMRIGKPDQSVSVTQVSTDETWTIATWNHGRPTPGEITAHTEAGGTAEATRPFTCSARLLPSGPSSANDRGTTRTYSVDQTGCFAGRLQPDGGVVLSTVPTTEEATFIRSLIPGEDIRIDWSLGWSGLTDGIGGSHILVQDGVNALHSCSGAICSRNPRTGIGLMPDGRIVLVVVDGRQNGSVGMSLPEFASFFLRMGATSAMNLDGGGSSTMAIKGQVANDPSDGSERSVTNAILIYAG